MGDALKVTNVGRVGAGAAPLGNEIGPTPEMEIARKACENLNIAVAGLEKSVQIFRRVSGLK